MQVIKWAQTRWPTFVEICQYVIDSYVPAHGDKMPLGAAGTTAMLLNASTLFANKGAHSAWACGRVGVPPLAR
eukprot:COSAG01_NODE_2985_length_6752_cov_133.017736_1_plen_73_part_00